MKKIISPVTHRLHHGIEHYRLEPLIDLSRNRIVGYEVLSKLKFDVNVEQWFARLSGRQQIDLLLAQISCVSESVADTCFYNLSVDGFLCLTSADIEEIARFTNICLEVADSSALKLLNSKKQYLFFKNTRDLQTLGIKIWVDDFCLDDLISLPAYHGKFDGVKIDRKEIRAPHLGDVIHIVKKMLGDIPVLIEGVESESDLYKGMCSGANLAQGYYWNDSNHTST
ncbi:EAL domain-containing protein [Citrobacter amalonaticus]|nr:EAL domain-containing protein [Citrobacter amalonaticus]